MIPVPGQEPKSEKLGQSGQCMTPSTIASILFDVYHESYRIHKHTNTCNSNSNNDSNSNSSSSNNSGTGTNSSDSNNSTRSAISFDSTTVNDKG